MDNKKNGIPKLRFPGFTGAWEQRKLGETSKITAGGDVDKEKLLTHGKYPVIANALTNDGIVGYYNDAYRITAPAVTVTGRGEIGKAKSRKINFTPVVRLLSVESKHNVDFLAEAINRSKVVFESTGVPQLTVPKLSNYKISFPVSENEETKIGDFIQQFDSLIALHQRKLEHLQEQKKGLLQKMFPKNGEIVPEVRFPGFTDAWEQRKLVSLFSKFTDGDWIESKDQANTGIRLIQTGNIGITEFINKFGNEKWISEETFKKLNCEEIFPGDIIISRLPDPAGRACILPKLDTRMITAVDCTIARTSRETSAEFIVQYLSTQTYFKYVQSCLAGGTRQRISRKNLANFNVSIPTEINEQKQIGFFFKQLDTLIALHQRKLEHLELMKKGLLQQMFV